MTFDISSPADASGSTERTKMPVSQASKKKHSIEPRSPDADAHKAVSRRPWLLQSR
ncbi:hypothetical protein [Azospirillum endophyticum]